jgi:hypothetical protein
MSSVVVFLPTLRTKSEETTIPTSLSFLSMGRRLILLVDITLAASLSEVSGSTVMRVLVMISDKLMSGELCFATTLLTMSRSVIIPTGNTWSITMRHPNPCEAISWAASKTLLFTSMVTTFLVIISLTDGIELQFNQGLFGDKSVVIETFLDT